jgi:type II secretory ATPase GspE/PulE/Tfp pilus assembly ATPase PilB-like protein
VIAAIDNPSFQAFPWVGLALWAAFAVTAFVCASATRWVHSTGQLLEIPGTERWALILAACGVALLGGFAAAGPVAIPVALLAALVALVGFVKKRDLVVPEARRFLGRGGSANIAAEVRTAFKRSEERTRATKQPAPSLTDRAKSLLGAMSKRREKAVAADAGSGGSADAVDAGAFMFLKKDGTHAIDTDDPEAMSENVRNSRKMLMAAMRAEATDIHFEPQEQQYFTRFRIDGVLQDIGKMPIGEGKGVVSTLKVLSDMNIAERRRPQDGTFAATLDGAKFDIRAASTPTSYGEKMVLRLLQSSGGVMKSGLDKIGLRPQVLKRLNEIIHKPYGMFLVVGPTGSGKTTTVYASLSEIDAHKHNITTIEDPVEYRLENITQIAVNTQAEVSFAHILRSVLRQDPDVLLVGEIRDKETAEIACQAALTGHFVFSTLHANDTVATITRLLDLGLDPTLIQTAVTAVLGQRLARKLCEKCKQKCAPPPGLLKKFKVRDGEIDHIYREKGCEHCRGTGFKGRMGIHELLVMNDGIRDLITSQPVVGDLKKAAIKNGTQTLQIDGLMKVIKGQTSVSEILRVTT